MILGVTGLMGSGKSYICSLFKELGVPVYNSDDRAKWINNNITELKDKLINAFGNIYTDGQLDRRKLREIVFVEGGEDKLKLLNSIVHPYVRKDFNAFCELYKSEPLIITESAILFESGLNDRVDKILFVDVPYEVRLDRTIKRDGITKDEYDNRMKNQISPDRKRELSDFVLENTIADNISDSVLRIYNVLTKISS